MAIAVIVHNVPSSCLGTRHCFVGLWVPSIISLFFISPKVSFSSFLPLSYFVEWLELSLAPQSRLYTTNHTIVRLQKPASQPRERVWPSPPFSPSVRSHPSPNHTLTRKSGHLCLYVLCQYMSEIEGTYHGICYPTY